MEPSGYNTSNGPSVARRLAVGLSAALVLLPGLQASSQQAGSAGPSPEVSTIRVYSRRVSVDVVVTDGKDKPVRGLTRDDFKIFEDGKAQPLRSFDPHVLEHTSGPVRISPAPQLPPNTYANIVRAPEDGPVTVILYDVLNTPPTVLPYAHEALVKFIKTQPPGNRTAIFVLGSKLRMLQGFTDDETRLLAAINSKSAGTQQSSLLLSQGSTGAPTTDLTTDDAAAGADPGALGAPSILGQLNSMETMEDLFLLRERLDATVDAFASIARFLSSLPGRKNLLWLSGSFPASVLPDSDPAANGTSGSFLNTFDSEQEIKQATDLLTAAHVSVYPVDVRGLQTNPTFSAANNAKVGPGAPPKNTFDNSQSAEHATMDSIADNSGGHAFYNTNGLRQAMQTAVDQGSVYYTLTYAPTNAKFDGSLRKIRVELAKSGYQLSYRKTYFADDPANPGNTAANPAGAAKPAADAADPLMKSMQHGAPISTELFFVAGVVPLLGVMDASPKEFEQLSKFAAAPSKKHPAPLEPMKVQHYEISLSVLGRQLNLSTPDETKHALNLTLALGAFDADGLVDNGFEVQVNENLPPAQFDKIKAAGYRTKLDVALPLDAKWLRLAVRDVTAGHTGTIEIPVPAAPATSPSLK